MLAQNFMTAEALGIEAVELDSLIRVLGMLERGEIEHFNMEVFYECGTPACICGWANHVSDRQAFGDFIASDIASWMERPASLCDLFAIDAGISRSVPRRARLAKPAEAATALRNYLTTGAPNWSDALVS